MASISSMDHLGPNVQLPALPDWQTPSIAADIADSLGLVKPGSAVKKWLKRKTDLLLQLDVVGSTANKLTFQKLDTSGWVTRTNLQVHKSVGKLIEDEAVSN